MVAAAPMNRRRLRAKTALMQTAYADVAPKFRCRLRRKTNLQIVCVGVGLDDEAQVNKARKVYLVKLPRPSKSHSKCGRRFVSPESLTKQEVLQRFLVCCNNPVYRNPKDILQGRPVPMNKV